jgi:hypothetical protein
MRKMKKLFITLAFVLIAFGLIASIAIDTNPDIAIWGSVLRSKEPFCHGNLDDYILVCPSCVVYIDWNGFTPMRGNVSLVGQLVTDRSTECQYIQVIQAVPCNQPPR